MNKLLQDPIGSLLRWPLSGAVVTAVLVLTAASPAMAAKPAAKSTATVARVALAAPSPLDKLSMELRPLASSPLAVPADATWAKTVNGQVLVKALIVSTGTDADLVSLRADVLARGGSVFYNYIAVRALSVMVPTTALSPLVNRSDVLAIAPNRATQRQASLMQMASGAGDALPGAGTASALDGRGVGIAVLDSGIDFRHRNLMGADGKTRVRAAVDFVAMGQSTFLNGGWTAGRDHSQFIKSLTAASLTWTGSTPQRSTQRRPTPTAMAPRWPLWRLALAATRRRTPVALPTGPTSTTCACSMNKALATWPTCWQASTG